MPMQKITALFHGIKTNLGFGQAKLKLNSINRISGKAKPVKTAKTRASRKTVKAKAKRKSARKRK